MHSDQITDTDVEILDKLYGLAIDAGRAGNLPIAAILTHGSSVVAVAANRCLAPVFHPGRHAELEALRMAPESIWQVATQLTLYTSLEPCLMCFGAIVLHRIGRVVFAAADPLGGALLIRPHLPPHVRAKAEAVRWLGPVDAQRFAALAQHALRLGEPYRQPSA